MSIFQIDITGKTKLDIAIERLRTWEPPEGYYMAFSGGKDSTALKGVADLAGVKYEAYYLRKRIVRNTREGSNE